MEIPIAVSKQDKITVSYEGMIINKFSNIKIRRKEESTLTIEEESKK